MWMEAFDEAGLDPKFYANRRRDFDEILPWDHLDYGISKKFLINEPWDITKEMTIMGSGGRGIPSSVLGDQPKNENLAIYNAYKALFPNDEMCIGDGRTALDLALKSSFLMLRARELC